MSLFSNPAAVFVHFCIFITPVCPQDFINYRLFQVLNIVIVLASKVIFISKGYCDNPKILL